MLICNKCILVSQGYIPNLVLIVKIQKGLFISIFHIMQIREDSGKTSVEAAGGRRHDHTYWNSGE